jgi:hypothetical protein
MSRKILFLLCFISTLSAFNLSAANKPEESYPPPKPYTITVPRATVENSQYTVYWHGNDGGAHLDSAPSSSRSGNSYYKLEEKINSGNWTEAIVGYGESSRRYSDKPDGSYQYRVAACYNRYNCSSYKTSTVVTVRLPTSTPDFASISVGETPSNATGFSDIAPTASSFIGTMSGSGGVSGGSANYNIPIVVPPGRNSMQPNV